jgi:hypothetical protein
MTTSKSMSIQDIHNIYSFQGKQPALKPAPKTAVVAPVSAPPKKSRATATRRDATLQPPK